MLLNVYSFSDSDGKRICCVLQTGTRGDAMMELLYYLTRKHKDWFVTLIYALYHGDWKELSERMVPAITKCQHPGRKTNIHAVIY